MDGERHGHRSNSPTLMFLLHSLIPSAIHTEPDRCPLTAINACRAQLVHFVYHHLPAWNQIHESLTPVALNRNIRIVAINHYG
ncbi:nacht and wd40 domain protein [Moniliophthora roreri]|nr:nacht and wd40 domain protein [Moniliophthora roreri]